MSNKESVNNTETKELNEEILRKERVASLIEKAKGKDRSIRAYASSAGVSAAAMSKFIKGEYIPTVGTMKKLTSKEASPRGVAFEDLMEAAGYETKEDEAARRSSIDEQINAVSSENLRESRAKELDRYIQYEKDATAQIILSLVENEIMFKKTSEHENGKLQEKEDLVFEIIDKPISRWIFEFKYIVGKREYVTKASRSVMFQAFAKALTMELDDETKLSFVIQDKELFQWLKSYEHSLAFRGEMSVILYDVKQSKIVDECYLSNYYINDVSREINLVDLHKM